MCNSERPVIEVSGNRRCGVDHMITIGLLAAIAIGNAFFAWTFYKQARDLRVRFSGIVDVDGELARVKEQLGELHRDRDRSDSENEERRSKLSAEYDQGLRRTYKQLQQEVSLLEENLEDLSFGLYKPHFNFQTPEQYKAALEELRDRERQVIREDRAATCPKTWTVGNSAKEGAPPGPFELEARSARLQRRVRGRARRYLLEQHHSNGGGEDSEISGSDQQAWGRFGNIDHPGVFETEGRRTSPRLRTGAKEVSRPRGAAPDSGGAPRGGAGSA